MKLLYKRFSYKYILLSVSTYSKEAFTTFYSSPYNSKIKLCHFTKVLTIFQKL